jgi:hypothetical protein
MWWYMFVAAITVCAVRLALLHYGPTVYIYQQPSHTGFAPNPHQYGMLANGNCMPGIRAIAQPGAWVIGFNPASMALTYASKVWQNISHHAWHNNWPLYRPYGTTAVGACGGAMYALVNGMYAKVTRHNGTTGRHTQAKYLKQNTLGNNSKVGVLLSKAFWYWGMANGPAIPAWAYPPATAGNYTFTTLYGIRALALVIWLYAKAGKQGAYNPMHGIKGVKMQANQYNNMGQRTVCYCPTCNKPLPLP